MPYFLTVGLKTGPLITPDTAHYGFEIHIQPITMHGSGLFLTPGQSKEMTAIGNERATRMTTSN